MPIRKRRNVGFLLKSDAPWVDKLTSVCQGRLAEPFASHLKHFCHVNSLLEQTYTNDTSFGQVLHILRQFYTCAGLPVPSHAALLASLMSGAVPINDRVQVVCPAVESLFPANLPEFTFEAGATRYNPAYKWSTELLEAATVCIEGKQFGLAFAPALLGDKLELTEQGVIAMASEHDPVALLRSLLRVSSYGIKFSFPTCNLHTLLSSATSLIRANPKTAVSAMAAALSRAYGDDMRYYRCSPEELVNVHGAPDVNPPPTKLFSGTAAEAMRLTKGAFSFLDIVTEEHTDTIRAIVNGLRPTVSQIPSFVANQLNDESFMDVMEQARTATAEHYFSCESQPFTANTLDIRKVCAVSTIVIAIGNYRCRHTAWPCLRRAVQNATADAPGPLYVLYDSADFIVHVSGSQDMLVKDDVAWSYKMAPVVSLHLP